MDYAVKPLVREDGEAVLDIFNHYVENSFAAYPESRLPYQAFEAFLAMCKGYPSGSVTDRSGKVVGFGMLRAFHPAPVFLQTAELTCFLHPDHTGKGIGRMLLYVLERGGREMGVRNLLAGISSRNPGSIRFHEKNGFSECGRVKNAGRKHGLDFDVVWMQKVL
ncbi:MAG: N-acetyltransferase family protein [Thermodesulfobacteriota bacterium]